MAYGIFTALALGSRAVNAVRHRRRVVTTTYLCSILMPALNMYDLTVVGMAGGGACFMSKLYVVV